MNSVNNNCILHTKVSVFNIKMPRVNVNQNLNMLDAYRRRELGMSNQHIYNEILANAEDRLVTKNHKELVCTLSIY